MPPIAPKKEEFLRYEGSFDRIKKLPGVRNVIAGEKIDIVELEAPKNPSTGTSAYIQEKIEQLEEALHAMGVDIHEIGFTYAGCRVPLRKGTREEGGNYEILSLGNVGLNALSAMQIHFAGDIGTILPPSIGREALYSGLDYLPDMIAHLRRLNVNPHDIQVGARFEATTRSGSRYLLQISDDGMFEVLEGGSLEKGTKLHYFSKSGCLRGLSGTTTSMIQSMKKL